MTQTEGLSPSEEELWRATMRIVMALPSRLDSDLGRGAGLTESEYTTLLKLSDASDRELRMTDLSRANGLSASRTTRLVDDLQRRGLVKKVSSPADARSTCARLTSPGMTRLKSARQTDLESARTRILDHVDPSAVEKLAETLSTVAYQLDRRSGRRIPGESRPATKE